MIGPRTVRDNRGGKLPGEWWAILPEGAERLVQVPDEMRKCVVFLYYRKDGKELPAGTAFFVGYPVPDYPDRALTILLTAHHVIAGIQRHSDDGQVIVRLNTKTGDAARAESPATMWRHADPGVDCAFLAWQPPSEMNVDYRGWHLRSSATNDQVEKEGIGIGDEVFVIGLFRNHLGRDANEPILRVGNIAAVPADPIRTKDYGDMKAILVEARSIGGLSGSPVFVHLGYSRYREGTVMGWMPDSGAGPFLFLGLMHGHWDALETEIDLLTGPEKINMGIGIVVPVEQIMASISPFMEEVAMVMKEHLDEEGEPTPDVAPEEGTEFERFEELTQTLVNTPKPKPDEDQS